MITFYLATIVFMFITWILFLYGSISKKINRSTMYGFLAISYLSYALSSQMMGKSWWLSLLLSIVFMITYSTYKKIENIRSENDINKKEENSNEL